MSLRRYNSPASDGTRSSSSSSKRMKGKMLDGKCLCGRDVVLIESGTMTNSNRWFIRCPGWATRDCKYFVWVDEIEEGWEGLARALAKRNSDKSYSRHEDGVTVTTGLKNQPASSMMSRKLEKFRGEVRGELRGMRLLFSTIALGVAFCLIFELYLVMKV
ncbi:uncharacterized protein LOC110269897 [Arachis ipaensis]|uniref:uncharacterized protein LOC110269897 n=1 Tax=Arachis ipaensis TaxID=130454 RepID=UPI000A2B1C16|nr:uncharacterized protein LOC110269897 [Arachis ipaensis]